MNPSENKLQLEILSDAERKAERLLQRARAEAAKALAARRDEYEKERAAALAEAQREADDKHRAITARIRHEVQCGWLRRREQSLDDLFAQVLPRLEQGEGYDQARSLRQLLHEALLAVGPGEVVVRRCPASAAILTETVAAAVRAEALGSTVGGALRCVTDPSLRPGVVVESADGGRRFDNTYARRLQRLRPALRALASADLPAAESEDVHA